MCGRSRCRYNSKVTRAALELELYFILIQGGVIYDIINERQRKYRKRPRRRSHRSQDRDVISMHKNGISKVLIANVTGFSEEKVDEILRNSMTLV